MKALLLIIAICSTVFIPPLAIYGETVPDADTVFISGYLDIYRTTLPKKLYLDALDSELRFICADEINAYNQTHDEMGKSVALYKISEQIRKYPECFQPKFFNSLSMYREKIKDDVWGSQYGVIAILLSAQEIPTLPSIELQLRTREQSNMVDSLLN